MHRRMARLSRWLNILVVVALLMGALPATPAVAAPAQRVSLDYGSIAGARWWDAPAPGTVEGEGNGIAAPEKQPADREETAQAPRQGDGEKVWLKALALPWDSKRPGSNGSTGGSPGDKPLLTGLYVVALSAHNWDINLAFPTDPGGVTGTVILKSLHGSRLYFVDNEDGTYEPYPGVWATMTRQGSAGAYTYTITASEQSAYVFDNAGKLTGYRNSKGVPVNLTYTDGKLTRLEDFTGQRFLALGYNVQGRLDSLSDPLSRTVRYGYDASGNLTVVTDTRDLDWHFAYTGTHLLRQVTDPNGHVVERNSYDGQGRVYAQEDGAGRPIRIEYGGDTGPTLVVDRRGGYTETYYYSSANTLPTP